MKLRSTLSSTAFKSVAITILAVTVLLPVALYFLFNNSSQVGAVKATDFKPGNIMSDYVFYNKNSMNVQQIQDFLNRIIPVCLTWNDVQFVDAGGTLVGPPYVCLNSYHENPSTGETSFEKGGGAFPGGISAAQIIYDAAQKYDINPQVLIVMLKKESLGPITSDNWPTKWQYKYSMGYACPDSGPGNSAACDDNQAGFYKQVNLAAWQFNYYKEHPNDYRYALGWNDIQYSPNAACGTKRVYIENLATLSLYIYTPYTPNDGALENYPGTANCGAYGNRNFFMFFNEWFGSTQGEPVFTNVDQSRFMQISENGIYKVNASTGKITDAPINKGTLIYFTGKTVVNNEWCLRTQYDRDINNPYCIPLGDLREVEINYSDTDETVLIVKRDVTNKILPITRGELRSLSEGMVLYSRQTFEINGDKYYRTVYDQDNNNPIGVRFNDVTNVTPSTVRIQDTTMHVSSVGGVGKTNILTGISPTNIQRLHFGQSLVFSHISTVGDTEFYISKYDSGGGTMYIGVESKYISPSYGENLPNPVTMWVLNDNTCKINLLDGKATRFCYPKDTSILVSLKVSDANNKIWYQSEWERSDGSYLFFKEEDLTKL